MQNSFWDKTHSLSNEFDRIWDKYVPVSGNTAYIETECLRAAARIVYDYYNNGFCNNKSREFQYLERYTNDAEMHKALNAVEPYVTCGGSIPSFDDQDFCNKINHLVAYCIQVIIDNEDNMTPIVEEITDMPGLPDQEEEEDYVYEDYDD